MQTNQDRKYLRLAGFDHSRAEYLKNKNITISKKLFDMCMETFNFLDPQHHYCRTLSCFRDELDVYVDLENGRDFNNTNRQDFIHAVRRIQTLIDSLIKKECVLGRNLFLDCLNLKQIVWFITNINTTDTKLGGLVRDFSSKKKLK